VAAFLTLIPNCVVLALIWFVLIFILRVVLRRDWLAAGAFVSIYMALSAMAPRHRRLWPPCLQGSNSFAGFRDAAFRPGGADRIVFRLRVVAAVSDHRGFFGLVRGSLAVCLLSVAAMAAFRVPRVAGGAAVA
jgi:hypothetical protein